MKTHDIVQGSPEWHSLRAHHFCASEAPAMMGLSRYTTRNDLLHQKATGIIPDVDVGTQILFDKGHAAEGKARPIAELIIEDDLFPTTGSAVIEGMDLLASFDGITMDDNSLFEHKLFAEWLQSHLQTTGDLPDTHWPQVEHQLLVSGAFRALFMTSDGTPDKCCHIWYESKPERRAALIAGWKQFAEDLATYTPVEQKTPVVAKTTEALPAVFVQVQGSLSVSDNLKAFGERLQSFIKELKTKPETDQDFADAEAAIKVLSKAEESLKAAQSSALEQVASVADMQRLVELNYNLARNNRLALEKIVKSEKENRKHAMVMAGFEALNEHVAELNTLLGNPFMPTIPADFGGVTKGLKSITSIQNAVDTELARTKIAANESFALIQRNIDSLQALAADHQFLFRDKPQLILKANDDLVMLIHSRINDFKHAEAVRLEAERERIRAEEHAKAAQAVTPPPVPAPSQPPVQYPPLTAEKARVTSSSVQSSITIKLGQISERLGFAVTAELLKELGIEPIKKERAAVLFNESQFPIICDALINRIKQARAEAFLPF